MKASVNFKVENLRYFDQTRSLPVARHVLRLRKLKNRLPFRVTMKLLDLGSSESKNQSPNYKWHVILMLWGISFFNYADRQAVFSVFPLLEREMQLTPVQLGMLGSSFAWVYGLCAPLAGIVVDRVRRKTAILGGLHAWSFICMATALSRRFRQLLFFRAAVGLGETFYYPASMSMISDYHGKATRSRAMGIHQTSNYLGTIGGSFFSGWIGQCYGWRWSFIMFGALGILLGLFLNRRLIEPQRGATDFEDRGAREHLGTVNRLSPTQFLRIVWTTPTVLLILGAFMCTTFVAVVLFSWMPKFLYDKFHLSLATAGLVATLFTQLASMIGAPFGGWLADRWHKRKAGGRLMVQLIGVVGCAPFVVLCGETQSVVWVVIALLVWGFFRGQYEANTFAAVFDVIPPEARGTAVGLMNMSGWLVGGGTAPVIIGYIAQQEGLGRAISLASFGYVAASILFMIAIVGFVRRDTARLHAKL